ncbi:MAG: multicopper oxidase domain-containing protein [Candidatus Synoicihabitans palmerolidicus]|nr:multicopper oxidase domain-containing protein [Candidatus Synoicihabitans palmerolidicus]
MTRLILMPGERADVVVDLNGRSGGTVNWMAFNSEIEGTDIPGAPGGPGNSPLKGLDLTLVELRVGAPTVGAVTTLPESIWTLEKFAEAEATVTRTVRMTTAGPGEPFLLDDVEFDHQVVNHLVDLNAVEIWEIEKQTNFAHPFHIHDVQFFVLDVGGQAPAPELAGKKDAVMVPAFTTVRFIAKFEDFASDEVPYMYHCHILTHEDGGMMGQFMVIGDPDVTVEPIEFEGPARLVN